MPRASGYYVYVLFRRDGSPFYVGKGCRTRISDHLREAFVRGKQKNHRKDSIIRSMVSAGLDLPRVKIATGLSEADAFARETALIAAIGRSPNGPLVNLTDGGEGPSGRSLSPSHRVAFVMSRKGTKHTEASRLRMRTALKGRRSPTKGKPLSPKHRAAISNGLRGNSICKGRKLSDETKRKISEAARGRKPSQQCIAAVKKANTGRSPSAETRGKLSAAGRGRKMPKRPPWSEERRAAQSARMKGNAFTKGRKLPLEEIAKRTASLQANETPERAARRRAVLKGRKQSAEHIAARLAGKKAAKLARQTIPPSG